MHWLIVSRRVDVHVGPLGRLVFLLMSEQRGPRGGFTVVVHSFWPAGDEDGCALPGEELWARASPEKFVAADF